MLNLGLPVSIYKLYSNSSERISLFECSFVVTRVVSLCRSP